MPPIDLPPEALHELLRHEKVVTKKQILDRFGCSPMTAWRWLRRIGYFSSISHNASYYTAADVPAFDSDGLWGYRDILFSRFHTLPATVIALVESSEAGMDVQALNRRLDTNLAPLLSTLSRDLRVARERVGGRFVHFTVDAGRREQQQAARQAIAQLAEPPRVPGAETVIAVLVAMLRGTSRNRQALLRRLRRQGLTVTGEEVDAIFTHYDLGKKKHRS
jgi:hypothetical protein